MELNYRNLGSWCEAVIVVLQGLMSSEGGTSTGGVTDLELADICQQSHVSVMGHNTDSVYRLLFMNVFKCSNLDIDYHLHCLLDLVIILNS